jgi:hypothetical protein
MIRTAFGSIALLIFAAAASAQAPERFAGEWRSEKSGHHGPMHAKLTPTGDGYDMRVVGRFAAIIPFTYRTHLDVVGSTPDGPILAAEKKLPLFGGSFRTTGVLTADGFNADYSAMKDTGKFTLTRRR